MSGEDDSLGTDAGQERARAEQVEDALLELSGDAVVDAQGRDAFGGQSLGEPLVDAVGGAAHLVIAAHRSGAGEQRAGLAFTDIEESANLSARGAQAQLQARTGQARPLRLRGVAPGRR